MSLTTNERKQVQPAAVIVGGLGILFVVFHLGMLAIYHGPPSITKLKAGQFATSYINPLLGQNWHLFSPNPGISHSILSVRCKNTGEDWRDWHDPAQPLESEFNSRPLSGLGVVLRIYRTPASHLNDVLRTSMNTCLEEQFKKETASKKSPLSRDDNSIERMDPSPPLKNRDRALSTDKLATQHRLCTPESLMDEIANNSAFEQAIQYAHTACLAQSDGDLEKLQFKIVEFFGLKYSERDQRKTKRWSKVYETTFPEVVGE